MTKTYFSGRWPVFVVIGLILIWRLFQIRDLLLPAWVDSVHHALLVRILLEQGTLPTTWGPYLPQVPFYYHFGFHLVAALFAKVSGITIGQAVLVTGQVWQVLLSIAVYTLALALWRNHTKALIAIILVTFVSQMPAYYTTWGRYTLLAGLTLLIFGMAAALTRHRIILAILIATTAITHYYAFLLLCLFLFITLIFSGQKKWVIIQGWTAGLLIAAPWLWLVFRQVTHQKLVYVQTGAESVGYSEAYLWYLLGPARNYVLLMLAVAGGALTIAGFIKSRAFTQHPILPLLCWSLILVGLVGPWRFGPFRPDHHAAIVLFLPVTVFATEALGRLKHPLIIWSVVAILTLCGVWQTKNIINPSTILANKHDVAALEWIEANTPPDANFLIDVAPWSAQWRGADGGWWIMPVTGRQTVLPPAAYGWGNPETVARIRATAAQIYGLAWSTNADYCQQLSSIMTDALATHYYTRTHPPAHCRFLQPVYQGDDDLAIYKIK